MQFLVVAGAKLKQKKKCGSNISKTFYMALFKKVQLSLGGAVVLGNQ